MSQPQVDVIPVRGAIRRDIPISLDVMIRITPPTPEKKLTRPALNLGLVLDRSGSMDSAKKMDYAIQAAVFAVEQLQATDRVSVTIFDDQVETIVPNTYVQNKSLITQLIRQIRTRNSTALHAGWQEGATQVRQNKISPGVNRVLLLSDGIANVGETSPDKICSDVHGLVSSGVSTTTLGVGLDYNEDLMEAMARSGDGNYYFIESPTQLETIFQTELQGLMATVGTQVSLGIEPSEGVTVADVLNDFDTLPTSRYKLPNMTAGSPINILVRLNILPQSAEKELCSFRLAWNSPGSGQQRHRLRITLRLPAVMETAWSQLAPVVEVEELAHLLTIARMKKEATRRLEHGDRAGTIGIMCAMEAHLAAMPESCGVDEERQMVQGLMQALDNSEVEKFKKVTKFQAHQRRASKPMPPPKPPE